MSQDPTSLHDFLRAEYIVDLAATTKKEALQELCELLDGDPRIRDAEAFRTAIFERESLVSTGIGLGVAIPHVKIPEVEDYVVAVGRKSDGLEFDSIDGQPVRLIFMIAASEAQTGEFVRMLARVVRLVKGGETRVRLLEAKIPEDFMEIVAQDDREQRR